MQDGQSRRSRGTTAEGGGSGCGVCEEQGTQVRSGEIGAARVPHSLKSIRNINFKLDDQPLPKPNVVRILGQNISQGRGTMVMIGKLATLIGKVTGVLRRIAIRGTELR